MKQKLRMQKIILAALTGAMLPVAVLPAMAQLPPAAPQEAAAPIANDAQQKAAGLISEAFNVASQNGGAQTIAVRDAAALLPLLAGTARPNLTTRWIQLAQSPNVARRERLDAYSSFFDIAGRHDATYASKVALQVPDAAARAGAFTDLSAATEITDWSQANQYAEMARRAARQEPNSTLRARALTFIAYREASLNPATRLDAVQEASSEVRQLPSPDQRDALLADLVGAAAKFDVPLARQIADSINNENSKKLAVARISMAEISQTTVRDKDASRVADLAKVAAPYDLRAVPYLLQLPPSPEIFQILGDSLPPIYPGAKPAIDPSLLQRMWDYAKDAPQDVYRDQLQSRLARLMVLNDLWRGREWGDQLAWDGGKKQVTQFVQQVVAARQLQLRSEPLRQLAQKDPNSAIASARSMAPRNRVAALLLIAGQILDSSTTPAQ